MPWIWRHRRRVRSAPPPRGVKAAAERRQEQAREDLRSTEHLAERVDRFATELLRALGERE